MRKIRFEIKDNDEDTRENINGKGKFIIKREDDNKI